MKKLSTFLAAVMMFVMVATAMGTTEDVKAFTYAESDFSGFQLYTEGQTGTTYYYSEMLSDYNTSVDITDWKFAICPADDLSLDASVCRVNLTNQNKTWGVDLNWYIEVNGVLPCNLNGSYKGVFFDRDNQFVSASETTNFIAKETVYTYFQVIDNSAYVYAYTYAVTTTLNANTFPTLYGADKMTPLTSLDKYMTKEGENGETVHIWRLNVLDASQVQEKEYSYYRYDSADSELTPSYMDPNGIALGYLRNFAQWANNYGVAIVDPFEQSDSDTPSNPETPNTPTTPNTPAAPSVSTNTIVGCGTANASVTGLITVLPIGTSFADYQITEGQDYEKSVAAAAANLGTDAMYSVFKLSLTDPNGAAMTQLADFVKVSLPVPANVTIPAGKTVVVYRCEENGTLTKCNTTVKDGVVTFETNHFSNYILSVEKVQDSSVYYIAAGTQTTPQTAPKTGDVTTAPNVLAMVSVVGIAVVMMKRKFFV